jgi:hypothetical protein
VGQALFLVHCFGLFGHKFRKLDPELRLPDQEFHVPYVKFLEQDPQFCVLEIQNLGF